MIGARIKTARIGKGLSQTDVADKIGLTPSHISKLESGKRVLSQSKMLELARLLDVPVSTILGDTAMELEPEAMQLARRFQALPPEKQSVVLAALKAMESA